MKIQRMNSRHNVLAPAGRKMRKAMYRLPGRALLCTIVGVLVGVAAAAPQDAATQQAVELYKGAVTLQQPADWTLNQYSRNYVLIRATSAQLEKLSPAERDALPKINIDGQVLRDHSAVLTRLSQIAAEYSTQPQFLTIAGWPALERTQLIPKPQRSHGLSSGATDEQALLRHVTIAFAAGNVLLRLDGFAVPGASTLISQEVEQIAHTAQFRAAGDPSRANQEVTNRVTHTPSNPLRRYA